MVSTRGVPPAKIVPDPSPRRMSQALRERSCGLSLVSVSTIIRLGRRSSLNNPILPYLSRCRRLKHARSHCAVHFVIWRPTEGSIVLERASSPRPSQSDYLRHARRWLGGAVVVQQAAESNRPLDGAAGPANAAGQRMRCPAAIVAHSGVG